MGMKQAAERCRRSMSALGTLEGLQLKKEIYAQVGELYRVIGGLAGWDISGYEQVEEYERCIARMREAAK